MRVYADAAAEMILRPGFLDIFPRGGSPRRIAWEEPPKKGGGLGLPRRRILAVPSASHGHAWIGEGRGVRVVPLDREDVRDVAPLGVRVLDAIGLGDGRVLACVHLEGDDGAFLRVVDGAAPDLASAPPLAIPESARIEWPLGAVWAKGKEAWPDKENKKEKGPRLPLYTSIAPGHPQKDGARFFDPVVLTASPHGLAGASVQNGLVFAIAADGSRIEAAFRVPAQGETELHPVRTAEGILLTVVVDGRESAILHITLDGRVLAFCSRVGKGAARGMSPPLLLGDAVYVFDRSADTVLLELGLADLAVKGKHGLPGLGAGQASVAVTSERVIVSDGESALRLTLVNGGPAVDLVEAVGGGAAAKPKKAKPVDEDLGLDDDDLGDDEESDEDGEGDDEDEKPAAARFVSGSLPRVTGAPSLALAEAASPSTWAVAPGGSLNVTVGFANAGGAGKGVYLEVGGPAVMSGHVSATDVRIGQASATFEKKGATYRAEVAAVDMRAALIPDANDKSAKGPVFDGVHRANVVLHGDKAGAGLVTIRIGPTKAEPGRGSIVQGKTITIR